MIGPVIPTIGTKAIGRLAGIVEFQIQQLLLLPDFPKDRNSGYFSVRKRVDGRLLFLAQILECPPEKAERYLAFSLEKGLRLFEHVGDLSSWQSRDESKDQYSGAIKTRDFILSFSGLPEKDDEAVMLKTAVSCGLMSQGEALHIASISDNASFYRWIG